MPTHQALSGATDQEFLQRMVDTHPERFGPPYWAFFGEHVAPLLPKHPVMLDLGCGPGLFLRDLAERYPGAALHGYDLTPAMIEHGRGLSRGGATLSLAHLDVATQPLPHAAHTVDLLSMSSVLHLLDEPLPVLAEIRRVLRPQGVFLLNDWVRQSLPAYLAWRREAMKESEPECLRRGYRLFGVHNKYTPDDWRWLLASAGFAIRHEATLRESHRIFVALPSATSGSPMAGG
jgi:SAM-dependent methyltransferase